MLKGWGNGLRNARRRKAKTTGVLERGLEIGGVVFLPGEEEVWCSSPGKRRCGIPPRGRGCVVFLYGGQFSAFFRFFIGSQPDLQFTSMEEDQQKISLRAQRFNDKKCKPKLSIDQLIKATTVSYM